MLRILYIYVAVALTTVTVFGQENQEDPDPKPAVTYSGAPGQPVPEPTATAGAVPQTQIQLAQEPSAQQPQVPVQKTGPSAGQTQLYQQPPKRIPAAQYSPLAAQGGHSRYRESPWQAIVHKLNLRNLNLGRIWEERRRVWLENAATNQYFWYAFWTTGILILSWFALAWVQNDRLRETWDLAEDAADALRYAEYCKRQAKDAIRRHNEHVEKCNRVIEAAESGLVTQETARLDNFKRELDKLMADNGALKFENTRLTDELNRRTSDFQSLTQRVAEAEEQLQKTAAARRSIPNAQLVERINRLEQENRQLKQQRKPANGPPDHRPTAQASQ